MVRWAKCTQEACVLSPVPNGPPNPAGNTPSPSTFRYDNKTKRTKKKRGERGEEERRMKGRKKEGRKGKERRGEERKGKRKEGKVE